MSEFQDDPTPAGWPNSDEWDGYEPAGADLYDLESEDGLLEYIGDVTPEGRTRILEAAWNADPTTTSVQARCDFANAIAEATLDEFGVGDEMAIRKYVRKNSQGYGG